jgi:hypothetical protein
VLRFLVNNNESVFGFRWRLRLGYATLLRSEASAVAQTLWRGKTGGQASCAPLTPLNLES